MHRYRKAFYVAKNKKYLSESEINETKIFFEWNKKSLILKKPCDNIDSVNYEDLDENADDDKYTKIGSVRRLFKGFDSDYYEPIVIDRGFDERDYN